MKKESTVNKFFSQPDTIILLAVMLVSVAAIFVINAVFERTTLLTAANFLLALISLGSGRKLSQTIYSIKEKESKAVKHNNPIRTRL